MENFKTIQEYPWRGPLQLVDAVEDLIKDKDVCDIGCGSGDIIALMLKRGAKSVVGIEYAAGLAQPAIKSGRDYVQHADVTKLPFPVAEVYYLWTGNDLLDYCVKNIESGKLILCGVGGGSHSNDILTGRNDCQYIETRTFDFDETKLCKKRYLNWEYKGQRKIFVYRKL